MKRCFLVLACLILGGMGAYVGQSWLQGQAPIATGLPVIPREISSYRDVVKKVLPAVVSIEAQGKVRPARPGDMQLPGGQRPFFDAPRRIDDEGPARLGFGSGFLISAKGVVVTNNHVVDGASQVLIELRDGRKFTSSKIKTDPKTDLAIVMIDVKGAVPYLEFGDSDQMEIGDRILAVGAPFGLTGTVTHGIISSKGRALHMNMYEDFLQTDAAINPGNSGGPLISLDGKVIGINSAIKSGSGGFQGVGMAIASNLARSIVGQLQTNGVVRRGYLGIAMDDVTEELAKKLGLKEVRGVLITHVFPNTPGDKAALKTNDVILSLGGKAVKDGKELKTAVAGLPLGQPIAMRVVRDGEEKTMQVTIEEQPKTFGTVRRPRMIQAEIIESVGLTVTDLTPDMAEELGYPETVKGVLVMRVTANGVAGQAGVKARMVIVSVDKKAVTSAKALAEALTAGSLKKGITLQARSPKGGLKTFVLKSDEEN